MSSTPNWSKEDLSCCWNVFILENLIEGRWQVLAWNPPSAAHLLTHTFNDIHCLTLSDKKTSMFFWNPLIPDTLPDSMKNIIRHDQTSFDTRRFKYCLLSPDMFTYVFRWIDLYYLLMQDISRNIKIYYHILSDISPGVSSDIVMNITGWHQTLPVVLPDIIIYYWIYTRYIVNNCHLLPDISSDISLNILRYITYWYSRIWTPPALWSRRHRRRLCWTLQWWTDHVCVVFVISIYIWLWIEMFL